jgi:hypothetical protein
MISYGHYRVNQGAFRPFISAWVLSADGRWVRMSFLLDTGADETFLHQRSISILNISTASLNVKTDVSGIGGSHVPYFRWNTQVKLASREGQGRVFGGEVNVFLDPHASRIPILGRDVLQQVSFACAVKSGSAYGVLRPGAALGVWRRLRSLPKTTKAGTSPRTPYLFTQLKNAVDRFSVVFDRSGNKVTDVRQLKLKK